MRRAIVFAAILLTGAAGTALADSGAPGDADVFTWSQGSVTGKGRLGLAVIGITDDLRQFYGAGKNGVLIGSVVAGSPAAKAGVEVGDVLIDIDGKPVDGVTDIWNVLNGKHKGDKVGLTVIRKKLPLILTAGLVDNPGPAMPHLGMQMFGPGMTPGMPGVPGMGMGMDQDWAAGVDKRLKALEKELEQLRHQM